MEVPNVGEHCSKEFCNILDFLPFKCDICHKIFCKNHYKISDHACPAVEPTILKNDVKYTKYHCTFSTCTESELTKIICSFCENTFCLKHRHQCDHDCIKYEVPENPRAKSAVKIKEILRKHSSDVRVAKEKKMSAKNQNLAAKVQLMKLKGDANGNKLISQNDRVYFSIVVECSALHDQNFKSEDVKYFPVFVSRDWSIGKAIDEIANLIKVPNRNDETNAAKLRLFQLFNDALVPGPMNVIINELLKQKILFDGQTLALKYCVDC